MSIRVRPLSQLVSGRRDGIGKGIPTVGDHAAEVTTLPDDAPAKAPVMKNRVAASPGSIVGVRNSRYCPPTLRSGAGRGLVYLRDGGALLVQHQAHVIRVARRHDVRQCRES